MSMPLWLKRKLASSRMRSNPPKAKKRRRRAKSSRPGRGRAKAAGGNAGTIRATRLGTALELSYRHVQGGRGYRHKFSRTTAVAHFDAGGKQYLLIGPVEVRHFIDD